jgi:hypothetical protein
MLVSDRGGSLAVIAQDISRPARDDYKIQRQTFCQKLSTGKMFRLEGASCDRRFASGTSGLFQGVGSASLLSYQLRRES